MTERNHQSSSGEGTPPSFITDETLEKLLQHEPAVQTLMGVLESARQLDEALRGNNPTHPLTRRYVMSVPGGDKNYPFAHDRVILQPKSRAVETAQMGITGMTLRYATKASKADSTPTHNGNILVTYGLEGGVIAEFLLNNTQWEPISSTDELSVTPTVNGEQVGGELTGVKQAMGDSKLESELFARLIEQFEPEAQSSTD